MLKFKEIDYEKDVDEIIALLNANFETEHTKSAFLWKHFENPFGRSYGLLALDKGKIVGLRMFMRWEFFFENKVIKAIRPVDTCTDHAYRGKGLFKKLTLQGLENLKNEYDLIFNTPNSNSKPGYLKMGWEAIEIDFNYKIGFVNFLKRAAQYEQITASEIGFQNSWLQPSFCQTHISGDFLKWRYKDSRYEIAKFSKEEIVVYKLTSLKSIKTLILIDVYGPESSINDMVHSVCIKNSAKALYFLKNEKNKAINLLFHLDRGSQVVVKKEDKLGISEKINFSVGDLEGRL